MTFRVTRFNVKMYGVGVIRRRRRLQGLYLNWRWWMVQWTWV